MSAVNFSIDVGFVDALKKVLALDVFVETGTFRGDTVELVKDRFSEIYTVELSPEYYEQAWARFRGQAHIHVKHANSAEMLREIAAKLKNASVFYFLDAHWCIAENAAGASSQCPLLDEIQAIGRLNSDSLIVIDDARLFLAPPPAPHEISQWPSLNEVLLALHGLSDGHSIMVLNDTLIFLPKSAENVVRDYGHEHGVDWLAVLHKTRDYDNLRIQFDGLQSQLDDVLIQLKSKDVEIGNLKEAGNEKDVEIGNLKEAGNEKDLEIGKLLGVCAEREELIIRQAQALKSHYFWRLWGLARRVSKSVLSEMKTVFVPRMGVLIQHPPRPLAVPDRYRKLPKLINPPRVSMVTPSYNQAVYIERTIRSVLDQGYPNLEYIVQDGGSQDGTKIVLEKYATSLSHWESAPDNGQTHAINLGFAHAHGEIMAYLNSDDILLPGALHYVADYFAKHPDVDVVYSHRVLIDENDQEIGRWILPPHDDEVLSWADFIPQETLFWRRRAWEKIGSSLDESFHFAMDWDLLLRLRDSGAKFMRLPRFLAAFRIHPMQKTSAEIGATGFEEMARLRERCHGRPVTEVEIMKGVASYLLRHVVYDKLQCFIR